MTYVSYGLEVALNESVAAPPREFDVVWIGRVHRQKGIDNLLSTLEFLAARVENFRAVFVGNVKDALTPEVEKRGLAKNVAFSGFVSETEKIRLFKASRLFLMPSRHEGSPRVIGESDHREHPGGRLRHSQLPPRLWQFRPLRAALRPALVPGRGGG